MKSVQQPVEKKQLLQQPRKLYSTKVAINPVMLRNVLANEIKKNVTQHGCQYKRGTHEEELCEHSKSGTEASVSEYGSYKIDEHKVIEDRHKLQLLDRERKCELQKTERELVDKR